jgi:hypothetical protein
LCGTRNDGHTAGEIKESHLVFLGKFDFRRVDFQIITKKTSEKQWADFGGLPDRLAECFESDRKTGLLNEWGGSGFDH